MVPNTVYQLRPVQQRLRQLGLSTMLLTQVIRCGADAYRLLDEHDPATTAGFMGWAWTVRALRAALLAQGWRKCDAQNFAQVISPTGRLSVVVVTGDQWTGSRWGVPNVRSRRGKLTAQMVRQNQEQLQLNLLGESVPRLCQSWAAAPQRLCWMLLIRRHANGDIHSELSLPAGSGVSGKISCWEERILLPVVHIGQGTSLMQRRGEVANASTFGDWALAA